MRVNASISDKNKENVCDVESYEVNDDLSLSKIRKKDRGRYVKILLNATNGSLYVILVRKAQYFLNQTRVAAYRDFSPVELFELFVDENLIDMINVHETVISFSQHSDHIWIVQLSSIKHFRKNSENLRNVIVRNSMRRNRFEYIKKIIYFHDNILNYDDKYSILRF